MSLPPTPPPSSASLSMRANRRRDTNPEMRLRRALHAVGYRYFVDKRLDLPGRRVRADLVFAKARVAIFVDGCFWHGCPEHCRMPSDPSGYWHAKLRRNIERDQVVRDALTAAGWQVVRIWEHTSIDQAVNQVQAALSGQQDARRPPQRPDQ
jgi:DNA mismatch endonuclease, patch repair protein